MHMWLLNIAIFLYQTVCMVNEGGNHLGFIALESRVKYYIFRNQSGVLIIWGAFMEKV